MNSLTPNQEGLPQHVAIIMDGNGRWAQARKKARIQGHHEGAKRVDDIVTECCQLGIRYLTLYTFSSENWNRPKYEVDLLMTLLVQQLRTMDKKLRKNGVSLKAQGNLSLLPSSARQELSRVIEATNIPNPNLILSLALSYGGRQEIVDAAKQVAEKVLSGEYQISDISEELFAKHLYHPDFPDPDLLIRTGGDWRISNFLLWEIAYSELYVTPDFWPDFVPERLREALEVFSKRKRRFGKTQEQISPDLSERPS